MISLTDKQKARFWAKVNERGPDECWLWTAATDKDGYGHFRLNGKNEKVHRLAWKLYNGDSPSDKPFILHHCHTRACVNPRHTYPGTPQDNADAKVRARRQKGGELKLTEGDVREIRASYAAGGVLLKELSERYDVSRQHISSIINRHVWKHI